MADRSIHFPESRIPNPETTGGADGVDGGAELHLLFRAAEEDAPHGDAPQGLPRRVLGIQGIDGVDGVEGVERVERVRGLRGLRRI